MVVLYIHGIVRLRDQFTKGDGVLGSNGATQHSVTVRNEIRRHSLLRLFPSGGGDFLGLAKRFRC